MWLPDWLYKALPHIYMAAGLLSLYHATNMIGKASGVPLILAALFVWHSRKGSSTKNDCRTRNSLNN